MRDSKPILLVEDDRLDAMTVKRALNDLRVSNELVHKPDGEQAVEYLKNGDNKKPGVILLDLNTPKMNGSEFLKVVKADNELKKIPVIVLTGSSQQDDVEESFKLGAAGYMVKPIDYARFVEVIRTIDRYWTLSELPGRG